MTGNLVWSSTRVNTQTFTFQYTFCGPFFIMKETNFASYVDDNTTYFPTKSLHNLISCFSGFQIIKRI